MESTIDNQLSNQDLQSLVEYLSNVSTYMLDSNKDYVYKELLKQNNVEIIKNFATDRNNKLICISKNETDTTEEISNGTNGKPVEIIVENDLQYKGTKTASVCFIKKENSNLELSEGAKSLSSQLQVLNFASEGNDMNVFLFMQNYIQTAFSPLFNSYQNAVTGSVEGKSNIKSNTLQTVQNKMAELVFLLNQSQKNSEIPNVKLECDPEIRARIVEIKSKGREPTAEDFADKINDDFIMKLIDTLNRWKIDIGSVLKLDRQISQGNTLQEVNFWKDYETTLRNSIFYFNFSSKTIGIKRGQNYTQYTEKREKVLRYYFFRGRY